MLGSPTRVKKSDSAYYFPVSLSIVAGVYEMLYRAKGRGLPLRRDRYQPNSRNIEALFAS